MCCTEYNYKICRHKILEHQPGGCDCHANIEPWEVLELCPPCFADRSRSAAPLVRPIDLTGEGRRFKPREYTSTSNPIFFEQRTPSYDGNDSIQEEVFVTRMVSSNGGLSNFDSDTSHGEESDEGGQEDPVRIAVDVCRQNRDPYAPLRPDDDWDHDQAVKQGKLRRLLSKLKSKLQGIYEL